MNLPSFIDWMIEIEQVWQSIFWILDTKDVKSYDIKGCYKWDFSHLNLAPFLFVLITCEPMRNIETSISANHNLLLFEKRRQIQMGKVPLIASLNFIGFYSFSNNQLNNGTIIFFQTRITCVTSISNVEL